MSEHRDRFRGSGRGRTRRWIGLAGLIVTVAVGVALSGTAHAHHTRALTSEQVRAALSRHPLRTLDGKALSLESLRGEVVVVNFWASWCAPCRRELPSLNALHAEISQKGGRVLAVSIDHEARNVRRFVEKHGLTLPIYHDGPEGLASKLELQHIPYTLVLDRSGNVAFSSSGADDAALEALGNVTRQLIARKPMASRTTEGETR